MDKIRMVKEKKKFFKFFGRAKMPYRTVYWVFGFKISKRNRVAELSDKIIKLQDTFQDALSYIPMEERISLEEKLDSANNVPKKPIRYLNDSNKVIIVKENGEKIINPPFIEGLNIKLTASNNTITIYEPYIFYGVTAILMGDIDIVIKKNSFIGPGCLIKKTRNTHPNKLILEDGFHCGKNCTIDLTDAGDVLIGEDAKWSWNIYVKSDDTHPVFDINTKECLNKSSQILVGNHCWIGMNAVILKNSEIKDNSIVGAYAVVAKKFEECNIVIAGNPAQILKRNINWTHGRISTYIKKTERKIR